MSGYYQVLRTEDNLELMKYSNAYVLLSLIAFRAKRTCNFNALGLKQGEALIGDYRKIGLSRQNYRTALQQLEKWQFVTTQPTNKGTIVKLINSMIFDININNGNHQTNQRVTNDQPTGNQRVTTNKNDKNIKNDKKEIYVTSFDKFWELYPARNGKKLEKEETRKRFHALKEADLPLIIQAVKDYTNNKSVKEGIGIRDPKRFIISDHGKTEFWREWIKPEFKPISCDPPNPLEKPKEKNRISIKDVKRLVNQTFNKGGK